MLDFFREGGWGMWPILVFGMVTVGAALRFARKPETGQIRFIAAMGLTTLVTTFHATWTDIAAVLGYLGQQEEMAEAQFRQILIVGLKESTRPGTLGGLLLMLACLLVAVGILRLGSKDKAGAKG